MARRNRKSSINKVEIQQENLNMITPDTNVNDIPYQGYISNQDYYTRMQLGCFELDGAINEIISKRFTGNAIRNMSDEDAIEAYKAMEKAKLDRSKAFLDLTKQLADNDFFKRQQELERLRLYGKNKIIDGEPAIETSNTDSNDIIETETPKQIEKIDRENQQRIIRLLQDSILEKIERGDNE